MSAEGYLQGHQPMDILSPYDIFLSFLRWSIGLSVGCAVGFLLALLGSLKRTNLAVKILVDFLRAIPIIGLVPVIQMNIGINEYGKIGLIAWAVLFPVSISVRSAMDKNLESASLMLRAAQRTSWTFFKLFTLPKLLGGFLRGIEIAIGIAWLAVVAAEWVGTYTQGFWGGGLGYKLIVGYELNNWRIVHFNLIVFGLLGFLTAYSWRWITNLVFTHNKSFNPIVRDISTI
jgi:sulfonate transport system permease protein